MKKTMALATMAARWTARAVRGGAVVWRSEGQDGAGVVVLGRASPEARINGTACLSNGGEEAEWAVCEARPTVVCIVGPQA